MTTRPDVLSFSAGKPYARHTTVRDATFAVLRRLGITTIFGNPGSTEIPLLTDLPESFRYILALHEGSVVGIATGYAMGRGEPALVNLHTAAGLGNAINAIANARDCRVPLVIVVGQQDRRQLAFEPFLTGRGLERMAEDYLVWANFPARAQDLPGAIARAYHEARSGQGPALVVAPMGDWDEHADGLAAGAPEVVVRPRAIGAKEMAPLLELIASSSAPAIVVGAGTADPETWEALIELVERVECPVWQEPLFSRAGFPHDHRLFAGHLPWKRRSMREALAGHDLVLAVGTSALRTYLFDEQAALLEPGTVVAVLTDDPAEAHRSPCQLAVVAPIAQACGALSRSLLTRAARSVPPRVPTVMSDASSPVDALRVGQVFAELASRLPDDVVLVEESPSSRPELLAHLPARTPLGFVANGGGGLGFGLTGAIGLRFALPDRPVVAVLGDGSAMYTIQALWTAAHYDIGVLLIVMANGRYAVMDELARTRGGVGCWPAFEAVDVACVAEGLGCVSLSVRTHDELVRVLNEVAPTLRGRQQPLLLQVEVE
ncbi:thiamine pyrophosphate-binding protein [Nocardia vinacea]|uniref:thiamine pyrophosphate-binding protein n=1 Tax=Nocardia vinacea TaxID=96468 RepID=UPI0033FD4846